MAVNLVSVVMQFLTPDNIGRIAVALRLDRRIVGAAIGVAVPALVNGLGGLASQPGGPERLVEAAKAETQTLSRLSEMLDTTESFIVGPSRLLSSLLDAESRSLLAHVLGGFAGLDQDKSGLLLGLLVHVVMGTVALQQGKWGLRPSAVANLFANQKDSVAALPAELGNLLAGAVPFDSLGRPTQAAAAMRI